MDKMKNFVKLLKTANKFLLTRNLHVTARRFRFLECSPNAELDKIISSRYRCLPIPEPKTLVSYVWIDGTGVDMRMRSRTLDFVPSTYKDCPNWIFDGSSTFFSSVDKSDCYLVPIAMYSDPFRRGNNKIILCETFTHDKKPTKTNNRQCCIEILNRLCDQEVMLGFGQDFYFVGPEGRAYGWPCMATPKQIGKNYSGVGSHRVVARDICECIYRCCLYAGVDIYGTTAEKEYGQWKIITGPTLSIKAADDLWMTRYIIQMVAEEYGISTSFKPTFVKSAHPSGLHLSISTKQTRDEGGIKIIQECISKLEKNHTSDQKYFDCGGGSHLKERLTGQYQTCHVDKFKFGVGDRSACIRIANSVADKKKGFFEDRRPSSCADPYNVITGLLKSCFL